MNNPLVEYKKNSNKEWSEIAEITGMTEQGLYCLCRKDVSEMGLVRLRTAVKLKETIGVDLIQYVK